jgi:hypothetical protein
MSDLFRHIALKAKARSGFGPSLVGWLTVIVVSLIFAAAYISVAAFIALASRFDGVVAGLALGGFFVVVAGIAALAAYVTRLRNRERAARELAAEGRASFFDPAMLSPSMLSAALEIGRTVGWRRIMMLAAAGLLAAGLGREWSSRGAKPKDPGTQGS